MACENNDLSAVSGGEPFQSGFQALVVVLRKAVVEDQRKTARAGEEFRSGKTQGEVDLIHGSAADILEGNQLCLGVSEDIQILVDPHTVVDSARNPGTVL